MGSGAWYQPVLDFFTAIPGASNPMKAGWPATIGMFAMYAIIVGGAATWYTGNLSKLPFCGKPEAGKTEVKKLTLHKLNKDGKVDTLKTEVEFTLPADQEKFDAMEKLIAQYKEENKSSTTEEEGQTEGQTEGEGEQETTEDEEKKNDKDGAPVVLIVILSIVGIAAIAGAVWFFFCRSSEDEELDAECAVEEL